MDEKEMFDIRLMLLEADMEFEDYISKQQAEIDRLKEELLRKDNVFNNLADWVVDLPDDMIARYYGR